MAKLVQQQISVSHVSGGVDVMHLEGGDLREVCMSTCWAAGTSGRGGKGCQKDAAGTS